jgi:hypothetical protein
MVSDLKKLASLNTVGAAVCVVLASFDASAWLNAPSDPGSVHVLITSRTFVAAFIMLGSMIAVAITSAVFFFRHGIFSRVIGTALLVGEIFLFVWLQRYSTLGVFALGGGRYWINRAAHTPSDTDARAYVRVVLSATQYGVDVAENAVVAQKDPKIQRRLFLLLAECAPNELWRDQYLWFAAGHRRNERK